MRRILRFALLAILILLSLSTGITKLIRLPAEMDLFAYAGFSVAMTATYIIASGVVFASGMLAFAVVSLGFIALAAYFARKPGDPAVHPIAPQTARRALQISSL